MSSQLHSTALPLPPPCLLPEGEKERGEEERGRERGEEERGMEREEEERGMERGEEEEVVNFSYIHPTVRLHARGMCVNMFKFIVLCVFN